MEKSIKFTYFVIYPLSVDNHGEIIGSIPYNLSLVGWVIKERSDNLYWYGLPFYSSARKIEDILDFPEEVPDNPFGNGQPPRFEKSEEYYRLKNFTDRDLEVYRASLKHYGFTITHEWYESDTMSFICNNRYRFTRKLKGGWSLRSPLGLSCFWSDRVNICEDTCPSMLDRGLHFAVYDGLQPNAYPVGSPIAAFLNYRTALEFIENFKGNHSVGEARLAFQKVRLI